MGYEDTKVIIENIASLDHDNEKIIEIYRGASELGVNIYKLAHWKTKCKSYFNRYFKTSRIIVMPSGRDKIMDTLTLLCSDNNGRGFVFKNYNIARHLEFLGYVKVTDRANFEVAPASNIIPYIAYIEQKNVVFICEKVSNSTNIHQCLKNIALMIEYFLVLYSREIYASGVTVIGLLIREKNAQNQLSLTYDKIQQFKQTYFLFTPQQNDIYFSNDKHLVIQGSYGSGKSLLGLKKLELISKTLGRNEKIIYINFDRKSDLHFSMEKNVETYTGISLKKIKFINDISDILVSPGQLVYVCHNRAGENLSEILEETVRLNVSTLNTAKINYHLVIEEYDGETLTQDEADKITKLVKKTNFMESNIILLPQPLIKNRSWNTGRKIYERETCMFSELKNTFKIMQLEEVLRCTDEICEITKSNQIFLRNKESVFNTEMSKKTSDKRQQPENNKKHLLLSKVPESNNPDVGTSRNEVSCLGIDLGKVGKRLDSRMDLDQVFERLAPFREKKTARSKIVNKFDFLCEPKQGIDIAGLRPNLFEFSEDINLASDTAVISFILILKKLIGKNKQTAVLHLADDPPMILRRAIQLLLSLPDQTFSYTQDTKAFLQKHNQSKMIFCSNFHRVNGMEFDHVVIVLRQSEYYLKYYLPQAISR